MKRILFSALILAMFAMTGCELIPFAAGADMNLTYTPNPCDYPTYTSTNGWTWEFTVKIRESAGIGVTLGNYGPSGEALKSVFCTSTFQAISTKRYYREDIENYFGTDYIPGGSSASYNIDYSAGNYTEGVLIETYYGLDDDGNYVSCSDTLELQNSAKGMIIE